MAAMRFIRELRRRRVFRLAGIYLIGAWLLLQVADVTFGPLGVPPWAMTALVWVVAIGFPIALALSWRYDLTDSGIVRIAPGASAEPVDIALKPADYAVLVGALVAAIAMAYMLADYARERPVATASSPELPLRADAIAVLPFVNMSDNPAEDYFSDGIAEEILNLLTRASELKVIARTSSFAFKDRDVDVRDIARQLGARMIVEGSVRRDGERLRVTAQLIDASSGTHLWSENYDRRLENVFEVQDDIAGQVVAAIQDTTATDAGMRDTAVTGTQSVEAYDRYLLGNRYYWQRGEEGIRRAIEHYREAIELEPDFAHAWAALAAAYNSAPSHGVSEVDGVFVHDLAEQAAERAIELDASQGLAWAVLANVKPRPRYANREESAPYMMKALEVSPREPTVILWTAESMASVGRLKEGLRYAELGYEIDPLVPLRSMSLGCIAMANGQFERGMRFIEQAREMGLFDGAVWMCGFVARLEAGDFDAAEAYLAARPFETTAETIAAERAYLAARREPTADNVARAVAVIVEGYSHEGGPRVGGNYAAYLLASMGAVEEAYRLFELRRERGATFFDPKLWWLPSVSGFRRDERFADLAEAMRLPGAWRIVGWPDACRPIGDTFACR